jgi:hypothetical protein
LKFLLLFLGVFTGGLFVATTLMFTAMALPSDQWPFFGVLLFIQAVVTSLALEAVGRMGRERDSEIKEQEHD